MNSPGRTTEEGDAPAAQPPRVEDDVQNAFKANPHDTKQKAQKLTSDQKEKQKEKLCLAEASASSVSVPSSEDKSNLSNSLNSRKNRALRKKAMAGASGGEEENDSTVDEGIMRPKYTGNLHALHKPDYHHNRNGGRGEEDEYTAAVESTSAESEQTPGAFAFGGGVPSQDSLIDDPETTNNEAGATITTAAVLAHELNEEEWDANRLENEHLRREVSLIRRERENVEVVVAVRSDEAADEESKGTVGGMSWACKLGILICVLGVIGGGVAAYFLLWKNNTTDGLTPTSDLPCVSESTRFPLGLCVGDCDTDEDCEDGLECYERNGYMPVPGCSCGELDDSLTDYCVKKQLPALIVSNKFPLDLCHGDCDDDTDCQDGLICYQRTKNQEVPQCSGGAEDSSETDYCILDPTAKDDEVPEFLGECQGQCKDDYGCEPGLFCYPRSGGDIPGCPDIAVASNTDRFCVKENYRDPELDETNSFPLGLCEGDCDDDTDCQEGYFCYQRDPFEQVPGCTGGAETESATDFCVKNVYRDKTPLFEWGYPLVGSPKEHFGSSVSLSGDGQMLAVGTTGGFVNIYKATISAGQSSAIWNLATTLKGDVNQKAFGSKVALSSDGKTLVVGSVVDLNDRLAAQIQVYEDTGNHDNWTQVFDPLNGAVGDAFDVDRFDFSVAVSNDGKYIALGQASNADSMQGGPLIFQKNNGTEMAFVGRPFAAQYAGSSVQISTSSNGNPRVVAGGANSVRGPGQVRVMELDVQRANSNVSNPYELQNYWFEAAANSIGPSDGTMVDLSGDFMALVITNRTSLVYNNTFGIETEIVSLNGPEFVMVYQFKKQGVDDYWDQVGNLLPISTTDVEHKPTVQLSDDGQVLAIGEPWVKSNTGRVRVYKYDYGSNRWQPLQEPIYGQKQGELFGSTLSLVGGLSRSFGVGSATLAVGAPFSELNQVDRGSVRCYQVTEDSILMEEVPDESQTSPPNLRGFSS